jgi:hypothetical protein
MTTQPTQIETPRVEAEIGAMRADKFTLTLDTSDSYCDALVSATPELLREAAAILRKKSDLLVQLAVTREQEPEDSLIEQLLEMRAKREGKR